MDIYYLDGDFVPADKAMISIDDLAVLRGYAVFDFLRTYGRRPFYLGEHIRRLENSAKLIGLYFSWSVDEIADIVRQTIARNQHDESNIRIVVTGGVSPDSITPQRNSRLCVMVTALTPLPEWWYSDGVKVITVEIERYIPASKSTNYIPAIMALQEARKRNVVESIYIDSNNRLLEGTTSNLFVFIGHKLITPDDGILKGITRQVVCEIAADIFKIEKRDLRREELALIHEAFITASNKEIVPVVQIDDMILGNGKPGERTRKVMERFAAYTARYAEGG